MFDPVRRLARFDDRKAAHMAEMQRLTDEALALLPERIDDETGLPIAPPEEAEAVFKLLGDDAPELVSAYEALAHWSRHWAIFPMMRYSCRKAAWR